MKLPAHKLTLWQCRSLIHLFNQYDAFYLACSQTKPYGDIEDVVNITLGSQILKEHAET